MKKLAISVACKDYDRVRAIRDGRVGIEGCEVTFLDLKPEELFFRAYKSTEFDVCELSMSSYMLALSRGETTPYVAVPVFVSRTFRHSAIYVREDRDIHRPADLRGKRVGVPEYQVTAALWVRALLDGEYGVTPADFEWLRGGLEEPGRVEKMTLDLPSSIRISPISDDTTLDAMLSDGGIDALIAMRPPGCFTRGQPGIKRMFENYREEETSYYKRTGIFPIMHVVGIRRELVQQHPWLANSVVSAFTEAKRVAVEELTNRGALAVTLPWLGSHIDETAAAMGRDFWPYGVEPNLPTLEAMVKYAYKHGTTVRQLSVPELFVPSTLERFKV
ncbi:4,5-dihydroxyphthalate decarboxylase [Paraburkholderia sp. RAU6.4a]|uniref:ABC transporter substrate-binding protein n=1 Tax=Paraburkholderia sp. RAU6.4a TaxID=2991067 RepID=UPI003D22B00E